MMLSDVRGGGFGMPAFMQRQRQRYGTDGAERPGRPTGTPNPDDPNPPMTGYIAHTMTEGELMYYGHDSDTAKKAERLFPLPERPEQLCPRM